MDNRYCIAAPLNRCTPATEWNGALGFVDVECIGHYAWWFVAPAEATFSSDRLQFCAEYNEAYLIRLAQRVDKIAYDNGKRIGLPALAAFVACYVWCSETNERTAIGYDVDQILEIIVADIAREARARMMN